jgi:hypothetical protein
MHPVRSIRDGLHRVHLPHAHEAGDHLGRIVHSREFWMWVGVVAFIALFLLLIALTPHGVGPVERNFVISPFMY